MDTIQASLHKQLDIVMAKGDTNTNLGDHNNTSQLESPQFGSHDNYTLSRPESPDSEMSDLLALHSYTAFATRCVVDQTTEVLDHHLDRMAFTVTVMNGIALTASGNNSAVQTASCSSHCHCWKRKAEMTGQNGRKPWSLRWTAC